MQSRLINEVITAMVAAAHGGVRDAIANNVHGIAAGALREHLGAS